MFSNIMGGGGGGQLLRTGLLSQKLNLTIESLVTQFFQTSPNQNSIKLEALQVRSFCLNGICSCIPAALVFLLQ